MLQMNDTIYRCDKCGQLASIEMRCNAGPCDGIIQKPTRVEDHVTVTTKKVTIVETQKTINLADKGWSLSELSYEVELDGEDKGPVSNGGLEETGCSYGRAQFKLGMLAKLGTKLLNVLCFANPNQDSATMEVKWKSE